MADFVHLHNHSEFSLLDGLSKIKKMVSRAKELNMKALAITDHGNMYGTIYFYRACLEAGIKPIIGCEIYVAQRSRFDKEAGVDKGYNHLILLAENNIGYRNLMKIISRAYLEGYYYKPRVDLELLQEHHEGLICLSACVNGYVADPLLQGQEAEAEKRAKALSDIFGPAHFYIEIQKHIDVPPQEPANQKLIALAKKLGLPLVATNDNHYTNKGDAEAQEVLLCIQTQTNLLQKDRKMSMIGSPDFYLKSSEEMEALFLEHPEAITNSVKIADMCEIEITLGKWIMPKFAVPGDLTHEAYMEQLVWEGATWRYGEITEEIKTRIEYELSVIVKKGYATYFLTVQDFVNWAKAQGISVGPGRGSAAGSVISYCLSITDIDPFFFKLPFERFLNPLRPSAPDIDLDFADTRREEVIQYVTQKYGEDKVAQIITFGKMEAKGSVRDTGRAMGMDYSGPDRISKMIPPGWQGHSMTLENAIEQSPDLKRAYDNEPETKKLIDLAKKIEGVVRHASVHAAGVVIADKPITDYCPVQLEPNGGTKSVTQYDMYTVGEDGVGLLKMDFLGLRNLTIIEECLRFIKQNKGIEIDISTVPLDNEKAYKLLSQAETTGIFQLESAGMRRYIKELKPTTIFDLMAMVALYRPGPMQNIPDFIARKHNPSLITYPHPELEEILANSYGILTYQDDVLLTTIKLAGYTWLDADKFRKAMGKKIPAEMKKQQELFLKGAVKNGLTQKKAEELFELISPFAGYGFNKAHAACYATIAYRTAYLKANYPVEFMTALLTAESRGTSGPAKNEKIAQAVAECKRLYITLLPPDINKSMPEFEIEDNTKIRFGFSAVKNVGAAAITAILEARKAKSFSSFEEFCMKVDLGPVNKKTMESLIKSGAMDLFGNRAMLLANLPEVTEKANRMKKQKADGQGMLFAEEEEDEQQVLKMHQYDVDDYSLPEKLAFEKEFLGIYLTAHPQADYLLQIKVDITHELELLEEEPHGTEVTLGGIVETIKRIFTKKTGAEMAFFNLTDEKGLSVECILFPKVYEQYRDKLIDDTVVVIDGKLDTKNDKPVIIINRIRPSKSN
ncbi:MAG TPA: DNA polymerase III subunit alpha [Candidatus Saccharimonadales bacterium]|nr:DNA polymerase III subunit alpha [Candidatus Saccharimonadales bacterium]